MNNAIAYRTLSKSGKYPAKTEIAFADTWLDYEFLPCNGAGVLLMQGKKKEQYNESAPASLKRYS